MIGAGVAGVAAAHALRRIGIRVDLFEKASDARSTGYQLNVLANGMYALSRIGLLDPLRKSDRGAPMRSAPIVDGLEGRLVRSIPVPGVDTRYGPTSFYRGDLHQVLLAALEGTKPECGKGVVSILDEPDRTKVEICFDDGSVREFDFVVAADGAYSNIRQALFPRHRGYRPRFDALLFAANVDPGGHSEAERLFADQLSSGEFVQIGAPKVAVVLSGAGGGRFGVIIGLFDQVAGRKISTIEEARALACSVVRDIQDPRVPHAIDCAVWEMGNPLLWRVGDIDPLPSFHVQRVALVGDAAHAMIPVVGQGANQSFEDAMILAEKLGSVASCDEDVPAKIGAAFSQYSRERQPHVARVQREARRRLGAMTTKTVFGYRMSNFVLRSLPRRLFSRFDDHVLKYAIDDPSCPIQAQS